MFWIFQALRNRPESFQRTRQLSQTTIPPRPPFTKWGENPFDFFLPPNFIIKELKYKSFRFYFITDGFKLKCIDENALVDLLLRFVRMSDKKAQQETINEIKFILRTLGPEGFS